ncbi:M20/M25/M40 family metallo-hydrolase [Altererythrobacter soli]|uniref:M20/M25/M40 family metallo-hydrolase n=1 Tax=Croceibacterium soli TaxID=1739690 RepID=A0A6I4UXD0_9SPHN|nr:M20/M25/M40 family metallo-hydrolase [Croceibacterium soli]MXP42584.1 M20/M25/M40 family metallo-hydrolase [Croceibacterium soli]
MRKILLIAALAAAAPAAAQGDPAADVSQQRLRSDVDAMVSFGTRHTLSEQDNPKRGIGAALQWGERQFRETGKACGDCLEVVLPETTISGERIPQPVRLRNVVAIQRGSERPNEVVIVQGHIDSRVTDVMDARSDAPGANDNASGSALVLEAARVLSRKTYPTTIVYALLSGEEQGLYGGRLLADYAKQQGWTVKAVFNNDIVGGSCGSDGHCDAAHVRVFSEGPRADADDTARAAMRRNGGENDSPSRNLSRWIDRLAEGGAELDVRQIWRTDRMGRGGDQIPFLDTGYPAVRFSVAVEDYDHQHQDLRVEDGVRFGDTADEMDFAYLANVTRLNVRGLHALAAAPMPPAPTAQAAVQTHTDLAWEPVAGAEHYRVWMRRTDQPQWPSEPLTQTEKTSLKLAGVRGDDWLFGVSAVGAGGAESPIASAVPGGAYRPLQAR